ncbi:hypothetical protein SARC_07507 [Sphaeroforma arctica JP610]|uniref:Kinesin-associated microtubule-binding domain-containing protein n=1 Tax=Sphaeroforma arctica JP610 TaxID=667725 RepID=A0A0L0FTI8_9EUKA|nr:hypothetical protein SARC_07507 [Sphaeroforma arctica JP610]KNC80120.1 hypothetical protein SARC_07507 [Sphaeroforma arctica JP610]|eukprot:XP_014154022.1 hypothetical protein SARC_07507 [Sphaeroforma arctica JP610]
MTCACMRITHEGTCMDVYHAYIIEERRKEEDLLYREAAELKDVITHLTAQVTHLSTYARDADTAQTSNCKGARDLEVQLTGVCDTLSNSTRDFSANQKHSLDAFKTFLLDHIETEAQQYDAMANGLQTTEHSLTAQVQLMSTHLTDTLTAIAHASDPTQHHNALERVTALSKSVAQDIESLLKGIHDMLNDRGNQAEKLRETIEHQATQLGNAVVHFGAAQVDQFVALNQDLDRMLAAERQKVTDHIARHTTESANDNATQHAHYQQLQTTLIAAVTQGMDTCRTLTQTAAEQSQRRTRERLYAVVRGIDQCTTAYGNMIADAKEDALMQTDSLREGCEELGNATTPHLQAEAHTTITAQTKLTEIQSVSSNSDATITSELEALAHEITKGKAAVNDTVSTGLRALSEHTESLSKEVGQQIVGVKDELATAKDALSTHRQHYDTHVEALTDTVTTHIRSVLDATEESVSAVRHTTAALRTNTAPPHVDVHVYDDLLARPLTRPKTLDKLMLEFYSQRPMSPEPTAECDDTHNTAAEEETHALHNTMQRLSMSTTYATSGRENRSPDFRDTKRNLADTSITPVREAISKRIEFGAGDD